MTRILAAAATLAPRPARGRLTDVERAERALSETAFADQVIDLARLLGWRSLHIRPARTKHGWVTPVAGDGKGWPDLTLVRARDRRLVFAELKREVGGEISPTKAQLAAWATFGPEWEPFKAAWLARGFRHPPSGEPDDPTGQRGLLYPIVDARPTSITTWIREAKGRTAHDVVGHLIERWHQVQADAGVEEELPGATRSRSTTGATSVGDLLASGPDWMRTPAEAKP